MNPFDKAVKALTGNKHLPDIITITGRPGCGKSTIAKMLAEKLGYKYVSAGELFRQAAEERGVDVNELNMQLRDTNEVDKMIDDKIRALSGQKGLVVDGRVAWFMLPESYKVFIHADIRVIGTRVFLNSKSRKAEGYQTELDAINALTQRFADEKERYYNMYQCDFSDLNNFDLVVDNSRADGAFYGSLDDVCEAIILRCRLTNKVEVKPQILMRPEDLVPTQGIRDMCEDVVYEYEDRLKEHDIAYFDIPIIKRLNRFYIDDGHHRWVASMRRKSAFITCHLIEYDGNIYSTKSMCYDYEDMGQMKLIWYPEE